MNTLPPPDIIGGVARMHANMGGPMSRTRGEHIKSSLLGSDDGIVRCPRRICLRLDFVGDMLWNLELPCDSAEELRKKRQLRSLSELSPVEYLETILKAEGLRDPEELRKRYILPQGKLICGPWTSVEGSLFVFDASNYDVLEQALMLGLCTAHMYDPARPVLWTETSLTRAVELFDPGSFYA